MMVQRFFSTYLMSLFLMPCLAEPMKVRLVNGTLGAGRLEIYYNGEWATVCDRGFEEEDAQVACKMLGFNSTKLAVVSSVRYGRGSGNILLSDVGCSGAETSLDQCRHSGYYPRLCSHQEDVGVVCNITEPMKARLVNGTSEGGRLEIYYNGEWGTVCDRGFEERDAHVACKMLGFNSTKPTVVSSVRYGRGSGHTLLSYVDCSGEETSLEQCRHSIFYPRYCSHQDDVGVVCNITEPMKARLVDGTSEAGRLEIYYNGEWGTVCDKGFEEKAAQVACKMLGFNSTKPADVRAVRYGRGSGHILLSDVGCSGAETSLDQCRHRGFYPRDCSHQQDVGVVCNITVSCYTCPPTISVCGWITCNCKVPVKGATTTHSFTTVKKTSFTSPEGKVGKTNISSGTVTASTTKSITSPEDMTERGIAAGIQTTSPGLSETKSDDDNFQVIFFTSIITALVIGVPFVTGIVIYVYKVKKRRKDTELA